MERLDPRLQLLWPRCAQACRSGRFGARSSAWAAGARRAEFPIACAAAPPAPSPPARARPEPALHASLSKPAHAAVSRCSSWRRRPRSGRSRSTSSTSSTACAAAPPRACPPASPAQARPARRPALPTHHPRPPVAARARARPPARVLARAGPPVGPGGAAERRAVRRVQVQLATDTARPV